MFKKIQKLTASKPKQKISFKQLTTGLKEVSFFHRHRIYVYGFFPVKITIRRKRTRHFEIAKPLIKNKVLCLFVC